MDHIGSNLKCSLVMRACGTGRRAVRQVEPDDEALRLPTTFLEPREAMAEGNVRPRTSELGHSKQADKTDHSVCTTWGLSRPNFDLLNVLRKNLAYPELKRAVKEQRAAGLFSERNVTSRAERRTLTSTTENALRKA
jgi:hypothetical protein